jgi:4-aminobutyrate aminotransferase-like enzyme
MYEECEAEAISNVLAARAADKLYRQQIGHRDRCRARLRISADDVARMVTEFAASRGGITVCPSAYLAQSSQYRV